MYDGTVIAAQGRFAGEVATSVEYTAATDTLVFSTVRLGTISVGPSRRYTYLGTEYTINFGPTQLTISETLGVTHYAAWSLTLLSAGG